MTPFIKFNCKNYELLNLYILFHLHFDCFIIHSPIYNKKLQERIALRVSFGGGVFQLLLLLLLVQNRNHKFEADSDISEILVLTMYHPVNMELQ